MIILPTGPAGTFSPAPEATCKVRGLFKPAKAKVHSGEGNIAKGPRCLAHELAVSHFAVQVKLYPLS